MVSPKRLEGLGIRLMCIMLTLLVLTGCAASDSPEPAPSAEQAAVMESTAEQNTVPTVVTEEPETEMLPEESQSAELIAAREEARTLQAALQEQTALRLKSRSISIIISITAGVLLVLACLFLYLWRRAAAAGKKAEKAQPPQPLLPSTARQISRIQVGKVHGIGKRDSQQDSFSVSSEELDPQNGLLAVVADGMGGLENGDTASQAAVIAAAKTFYEARGTGRDRLVQMLSAAKLSVDAVKAELKNEACGTTLIMGLIQDGSFHFVSIGDSRICLYRGGTLIHLNREHSYLYTQIQQAINGEISMADASVNETSGYITSYLGMKSFAHIDIPVSAISLLPQDKLILMSDGIYNALSPREICLALQHPAMDAADALESFIQTKNYPDQDNYTAVILECQ